MAKYTFVYLLSGILVATHFFITNAAIIDCTAEELAFPQNHYWRNLCGAIGRELEAESEPYTPPKCELFFVV